MSARNRVALIQNVLIEHNVIVLPGLGATRSVCLCGERRQYPNEQEARIEVALHQAEAIEDALIRVEHVSGGIVDAEIIEE